MKYKNFLILLFLVFPLTGFTKTKNNLEILKKNFTVNDFAVKVFNSIKHGNFIHSYNLHAFKRKNFNVVIEDLKAHLKDTLNNRRVNKIVNSLSKKFRKHKTTFFKRFKLSFKTTRKSLQGLWKFAYFFSCSVENLQYDMGLLKCDIKIYFTLDRKFYYFVLKGAIITAKMNIFLCNGIGKVTYLFSVQRPVENEVEPLME
jgi:hypothetical protein